MLPSSALPSLELLKILGGNQMRQLFGVALVSLLTNEKSVKKSTLLTMKKVFMGTAFLAMASTSLLAQAQTTGNGAPSGAHYELGIIGVSNPKTAPLTGGNRHTIFVGLGSAKKGVTVTTNIYLTQGAFAVCDGNGFLPAVDCNGTPVPGAGDGAVFQLPCDTVTDTCLTGTSQAYTIWARALGTPGGGATVTTCGTTDLGAVICSTASEVFMRGSGQQKFKDVTTELTTIDTSLGTVSLFATGFENFFWQYDNTGLKLLQVRFYPQ
jgi:hypothetical protein